MVRVDEQSRPAWWPRWVPIRCGGCGAPWLPGRVSISWAHCSCPGAGVVRGHNVWYCAATGGCNWHVWPDGHELGAQTAERWQ